MSSLLYISLFTALSFLLPKPSYSRPVTPGTPYAMTLCQKNGNICADLWGKTGIEKSQYLRLRELSRMGEWKILWTKKLKKNHSRVLSVYRASSLYSEFLSNNGTITVLNRRFPGKPSPYLSFYNLSGNLIKEYSIDELVDESYAAKIKPVGRDSVEDSAEFHFFGNKMYLDIFLKGVPLNPAYKDRLIKDRSPFFKRVVLDLKNGNLLTESTK